MPRLENDEPHILDAVIIGGGLGGVCVLAEGVQQGFTDILLLDRSATLGGLWARLPAWQTIQNHPLDFCIQGFTTRKRVWHTRDVLHFIAEYVRVQTLEPFIRLEHDVTEAAWSAADDCWVLEARCPGGVRRTIRCRRLIACTGRHAAPVRPRFTTDGSVPCRHSSEVDGWADARDTTVVVVGGGASALDLCVNVLDAQRESPRGRLHWVVRTPCFFSGCDFRRLWPLMLVQLGLGSRASIFVLNAAITLHAWLTFGRRGLRGWLPPHPFDLRTMQYIPGRTTLLRQARRLTRHAGTEIAAIRDGRVILADGTTIRDVGLVLLGTGYALPERPAGLGGGDDLVVASCAGGPHAGRLFFVGEALLDTTGSAPLAYHVFSRVLWTLIRDDDGWEELPRLDHDLARPRDNLNGFDIVNRLVRVGKDTPALRRSIRRIFPWCVWRLSTMGTLLVHAWLGKTTVVFADRVLGRGLSLDAAPPAEAAQRTGRPRHELSSSLD